MSRRPRSSSSGHTLENLRRSELSSLLHAVVKYILTTYWMLPLFIDAALASASVDVVES